MAICQTTLWLSQTLALASAGWPFGCTMPSTSISKTEYDPASRVLSVWFVASGKHYEFEGVPPETVAAFRDAFAKGRFFNDHIRNHFSYRLVPKSGVNQRCRQ